MNRALALLAYTQKLKKLISFMCRHILNAQASIRAACCKKWFDCTQCHEEASDHELFKTLELIVACKKCRKVFKKDLTQELEEADEFCPHCDNQFVIAAKTPAEPVLAIESDDPRVIRDPRMRGPTDAEIEELLLA